MATKDVRFDFANKVVIIDGEKYIEDKVKTRKEGKTTHSEFSIFKKIEEEKVNEMKEEIKDALRDTIDKERILDEIVKSMSLERMKKIRRMIRNKAKIKAHDGCYGIDIDSGKEHEYIDLFE